MFSYVLIFGIFTAVRGSTVLTNGTLEVALSRLVDCATLDSDTAKIIKWIDTDFRNQNQDETRQQCEEKWLKCLIPPPKVSALEQNSVRFLLSHLNLCSESVASSSSSPSLFYYPVIIVLAILNLLGITGGFFIYSYHSDCKLRLRNAARNAEQL